MEVLKICPADTPVITEAELMEWFIKTIALSLGVNSDDIKTAQKIYKDKQQNDRIRQEMESVL